MNGRSWRIGPPEDPEYARKKGIIFTLKDLRVLQGSKEKVVNEPIRKTSKGTGTAMGEATAQEHSTSRKPTPKGKGEGEREEKGLLRGKEGEAV